MARRQLHKLSVKEVKAAGPGYHSDGGGLYLQVGSGGARSWLFLYKERGTGKRKELGLGSAAEKGGVALADARKSAEEHRSTIAEGKDPAGERKAKALAAASAVTFGEFADAFLESIKGGFKGRNTHADWKRDLEVKAAPLRPMMLPDIQPEHVLAVLSPMWLTLNRTARETRSRIERVLEAADAKGLRTGRNPATWKAQKPLLPKAKKSKRHHAAAHYDDMPGIVKVLRTKHKTADTAVNLAAEYIILTAVRTGEARFMKAKEINFAKKLWTIPAERMKTEDDPEGNEHEVPLCDRAIAILKMAMPKDLDPEAYVFAGQWSRDHMKPLGMNAVLHALQKIYPAMTTHGCRSTFRDWAGDETHVAREIAEMALAHKVGDDTELAYRRATALKKRRELMEMWGRYVEGESNVVKLAATG
ncbi:integrase arm-type DNA-binding domain-containing protein [Bradyrhizobium liaoningense]|uniref:tyrosine-type recombinase/integrase n=1 Tax=Bradyrhizobium liaoningense TaxID=43992 RepID=UPI001BAB9F1A|nr:site-specific integrase [Bradyrhizobium liaoningense]MBR0876943.1 integrase arm-type DNA-binding domain-containing protein [Bradyrhizobium liaoningense]